MTAAALEILHDTRMHRFATTVEGNKAYLDYELAVGTLTITHTWVPDAIGGRGIAGELVQAAFEHASEADLKVRTVCSYAEAWAGKNPQYAPLLAPTP